MSKVGICSDTQKGKVYFLNKSFYKGIYHIFDSKELHWQSVPHLGSCQWEVCSGQNYISLNAINNKKHPLTTQKQTKNPTSSHELGRCMLGLVVWAVKPALHQPKGAFTDWFINCDFFGLSCERPLANQSLYEVNGTVKLWIQRCKWFISLQVTGQFSKTDEVKWLSVLGGQLRKCIMVLAWYTLGRLENTLLIRGIPDVYRKQISVTHDYAGFRVKLFAWLPKCFMVWCQL